MVPFHEVFVGSRCNLQCQDCQARLSGVASCSRQEILAAMDSATAPREGISIHGGEPLLRSDLLELIQAARQRGFARIRVRTNGTLLANGHLLQQLIEAGCHHFEIKVLAADYRVHDRMTGQAESLHQTWAGLELLRQTVIRGSEIEQPFLGILIPLRAGNSPHLIETIVTLMALRPDRIVLSWEITEQSFAQVLPTIKNAINLSLLNRTWILTRHVPLCQMTGLEAHVAELYTQPQVLHEQVQQCQRCVYADFCPGVSGSYLQARGSHEIRPVLESRHLESIQDLVLGRSVWQADAVQEDTAKRFNSDAETRSNGDTEM